jgi:hypothetical protein
LCLQAVNGSAHHSTICLAATGVKQLTRSWPKVPVKFSSSKFSLFETGI